MTALRAVGLHRIYRQPASGLFARRGRLSAVNGVDVELNPGDRVGLVGESGGGKSTLLRMLLGVEAPDSGTVTYRDHPVRAGSARSLRWFRCDVQAVAQDPGSSLNPRMRVGAAVGEPLRSLGVTEPHHGRVAEVLRAVQLDADVADRYPDSLSGGQRQRVAIARALAPRPRLLLADEPVSALDAAVRLRMLQLLRRRAEQDGLGLLLVTHDLSAVREICDRVLVMRSGDIVERGAPDDLFRAPQHEYTRTLIDAIPRLDAL